MVFLCVVTFCFVLDDKLIMEQCDHIWRKFVPFGKMFEVFGNYLRVNFIFGIVFKPLWLIFYDNRRQIFKNNLAICSHCNGVRLVDKFNL